MCGAKSFQGARGSAVIVVVFNRPKVTKRVSLHILENTNLRNEPQEKRLEM